ncbi:hypothetical protein D9M69_346300 [compost metagenome]
MIIRRLADASSNDATYTGVLIARYRQCVGLSARARLKPTRRSWRLGECVDVPVGAVVISGPYLMCS